MFLFIPRQNKAMTELRIALQPKQKLFRQSMEDFPVTFYGGAKGGGKSRGMRDIFLLRRFQYPGTVGGIFRQTFPELDANHIQPLFRDHPYLRAYWHESKKTLTLPNGSQLRFCYCKSLADVDAYQGQEFDDLGIEEAGQWSETMISRLRGSNRTSKPGVKPRTALTGNPGGLGHGYLKRLFVKKQYKDGELPTDYNFIQALVDDNAALMVNDPDYVRRLDAEPNLALRRAFRWGDWDIFAGQFFQEINHSVHIIKPFDIPSHWNRFGAYDFGFNHPAAFGWFANDSDGNTYLYRELVKEGLRVDQYAAELNRYSDTRLLNPIVAGLDCWTQKSVLREDRQPPTVAEEFSSHGIQLEKAIVDRCQGAAQLRSYLAWQKKSKDDNGKVVDGKPRLFFFSHSPEGKPNEVTFDTISRMVHDPDKLEDVLKINATEGDPLSGDDAYDMARYGLMSRPHISDMPKVHHKPGSPEYNREQEEMHLQAAMQQVKRTKDMAENKNEYGSWNKDRKGISDWNKW
jgi:phage terminase large subunit